MILQSEVLDLIAAVGEGSFENPMWTTFLARLREVVNADVAVLHFRSPGRTFDETIMLMSGADMSSVEGANRANFPAGEPPIDESLTEGRPYRLEELLGQKRTPLTKAYGDYLSRNGIVGVRQMRVREASGVFGWLSIVRRGDDDFTDADDAVLEMIAPFLRTALRHYVVLERERFGASLIADVARGLFGWVTLDRAGNILETDEQGAALLDHSGCVGRSRSGRLTARDPALERDIHNALRRVIETPTGRPQVITLARDPWLDMLILPARRTSFSSRASVAAIAYIHGDSWRSADRCEQLAQLFRLSPGEARLALALCRGMTIAEAAQEFGLATGTARNYCKSIYAKTGTRGQPDLVRIVMRSVLAIAPDMGRQR